MIKEAPCIPGIGKGNLEKLRDELAILDILKQEREKFQKEMDAYNYDLKILDGGRNESIRKNS